MLHRLVAWQCSIHHYRKGPTCLSLIWQGISYSYAPDAVPTAALDFTRPACLSGTISLPLAVFAGMTSSQSAQRNCHETVDGGQFWDSISPGGIPVSTRELPPNRAALQLLQMFASASYHCRTSASTLSLMCSIILISITDGSMRIGVPMKVLFLWTSSRMIQLISSQNRPDNFGNI